MYPKENTNKPIDIPITAIHFVKPDDHYPPIMDWISTMCGVLTLGVDLRREPCDIKFNSSLAGELIQIRSLGIMKGVRRLTSMAWILMYCMRQQPNDPQLHCVHFLACMPYR